MNRASSWCAGAFKVVRISTLTTLILSAGFMLAQSAASSSQTFAVDANLDNSTKNLSTCVEPTCNPGGNPSGPTAYSSTVVATTPCGNPADGSALELSVTGPAYVNALWTYKMGAMNNATHFRLDFDACFDDSIATDQAFEADIALFVSGSPGWNYMFGGQCNLAAGVYDVWNQANPAWIPTAIPCTATTLVANQWHHFQREVHYDSSNALWFDYLCINGQCWGNTSLGKYSAGALPNGWGSTRIWQFQLDLGAAGGKTTMWLNNVTGSAWQ